MNAATETEHAGRVLVVQGSPDRATREIAETIADELRASGLHVDLTVPPRVGGLAGYRAVVVGSRLLLGHWHPVVGRFLRRHAPVLRVRPLWLFQVDPHLHRAAAAALTGLPDDAVPRLLTEVLDQPAVATFHPDESRANACDIATEHRSPARHWARTIAASVQDREAPAPSGAAPRSEPQAVG